MLRGVGLTLLCLAAMAVPAEASERGRAVDGSAIAAQQGATTAALRTALRERSGPVQVARIMPTAQPGLQVTSVAGLRREVIDEPAGSVSLRPERRQGQNSSAFPWRSQGRSDLAWPLSERLLVGLGYRHMEGEDLWPEFADTGAAGYDSHQVLIRAHWRF